MRVCCAVHLERDVFQIFSLRMSQWSRGSDPEICSSQTVSVVIPSMNRDQRTRLSNSLVPAVLLEEQNVRQ